MILTINIHNKSLVCLATTNIRTVSIVNACINVTMNSKFGIDDLKIYTDSVDECRCIYDRIIYCINNPTEAVTFSKDYLEIGCDNIEEGSDEEEI